MNFDFSSLFTPPKGGWKCPGCNCTLDFPGACDPCGERWEQEQNAKHKAGAYGSIPSRFKWADFTKGELAQRVAQNAKSVVSTRTEWGTGCKLGREAADGLGDLWPNVVVVGNSGAGKTSLAVAMLKHLIADKQTGYAARFVSVVTLARCRRDERLGVEPELIETARKASFVVLDDLGQEETGGDTVREFIHTRHNTDRPSIFTTWMRFSQVAKKYDEGTARRVFEGSLVIDLDGGSRE